MTPTSTKLPLEGSSFDKNNPTDAKNEKSLPKLTPSEYKQYNRLADHMNQFVSMKYKYQLQFYDRI